MNNLSHLFSWPGEAERMRQATSSARVQDTAATGAASECRVLETNGGDEDMSGKQNVEGSGPSGVSSWLRQSMRRVRHFNLGEPTRIRSAPPDAYRLSLESAVSEPAVSPVASGSERVSGQNQVAQQTRPRSAGTRAARRQPPRARPVSAPARRPASASAASQLQAEPGSAAASTPTEAQDNLGYESDSADRLPSPRR